MHRLVQTRLGTLADPNPLSRDRGGTRLRVAIPHPGYDAGEHEESEERTAEVDAAQLCLKFHVKGRAPARSSWAEWSVEAGGFGTEGIQIPVRVCSMNS